jgi:biotin operon repressor
MSIRIMSLVFENQELSSTEKLIMLALADHANDEGKSIYPSQSTVSRKTGLARGTVNKHIQSLIDKEYLWGKGYKVERSNVLELEINIKMLIPDVGVTENDTPPVGVGVTENDRGVSPRMTRDVTEDDTNHHLIIKESSFNKLKLSGDLFKDCQAIYEQLKGRDIGAPHKFVQMINNFKKNGVIAKDYYESIIDQDASGKYPRAQSATSYESWTLTHAHNRLHPVTPNNNGHKKDDYPEIDPNSIWVTPDGTEYNAYGEVVGTWKK